MDDELRWWLVGLTLFAAVALVVVVLVVRWAGESADDGYDSVFGEGEDEP